MKKQNLNQLKIQHENQTFDRKSFLIEPKNLATIVVAMANADGGDIAIGIEDDGRITGINGNQKHLNELLRVPFDYCLPTVKTEIEFIDCTDYKKGVNRILLMHVAQSPELHTNQADEAFYRVGDKSKKLNFEQRIQLFYAKGCKYFEDAPVADATLDDIDLKFVKQYCKKIGYSKGAEAYLRSNKSFIKKVNRKERISGAAILLFGKCPQQFFQRARVRVVRFDGDEERFGREMNVVKDVIFEGRILEMTTESLKFVSSQIKEYTFLGPGARFVTQPQYPEFCWTELIVNAIAHRDYSIMGTDIIIKIFDHRLVVESPGILPGMVRLNNIRQMHFSRNPKIAEFMHQYEFVKEFGEGVDRLFREMEQSGNPAPEYRQYDFMLKASLASTDRDSETISGEKHEAESSQKGGQKGSQKSSQKSSQKILELLTDSPNITTQQLADVLQITRRAIAKQIASLQKAGKLKRVGSDKGGHWEVTK